MVNQLNNQLSQALSPNSNNKNNDKKKEGSKHTLNTLLEIANFKHHLPFIHISQESVWSCVCNSRSIFLF